MKTRRTLAGLAMVAAFLGSSMISSAQSTASASAAQEDFLCRLSPQTVSDLPSWSPAPPHQVSTLCGSCTPPICQGKEFGEWCENLAGKVGYCNYDGNICSDGNNRCYCQIWASPL